MAENQLPKRSEVPDKYKWRMEDIFATDEAFLEELQSVTEASAAIGSFEGRLGEGPEVLYEYLELRNTILTRVQSLFVYGMQRSDEDTSNAHYQDLRARAVVLMHKVQSLMAFESPELLSLPEGYVEEAIASHEGLKVYAHYLEDTLRDKPHVLSQEMEELMALTSEMGDSPREIYTLLSNADMKFESVRDQNGEMLPISNGRFVPYLESCDRPTRIKVFKSFYKSVIGHENTIAAVFASMLKKEQFYRKARKFDSAIEMHLHGTNVPVSVYDGLIEAVHEALPDMYRYVSLRKRLLKIDDLHMYDAYASLAADYEGEYTFEEAKAIVAEGLAPLGQEYIDLLNMGMNGGWIDVMENEGKRSGAYSFGDYAHHPYVLMNYVGNLDNVLTLAHEMGHSLHSWYANHTHNRTNAAYSIFVAEIASTCNEALLMKHLLGKCTDPKEKLFLLNHYIERFKSTIFRQTMFAEFEKIVHQMAADGKTLNARALCKVYGDLNALYFGPEMARDPEIAYEWMRIPHFYTPFYVYQYATGFSSAIALSSRILNEGEPAVKDYISFLKAGGSDYPIEVLKKAGVDMTTKAPVQAALKVFAETLDEMVKIADELAL